MSDVFAKDFKILLFNLPNLSTDILGEVAVHCSDYNDLKKALAKYHLSTIIIAGGSCKFSEVEVDGLLKHHPVDTLYLINEEEDTGVKEWLDGLEGNNIIVVQNEQQLMRRLCTTAMLCYYKQNIEYKNKENNGMANLCILHSLKLLDYSTKFM